MQNLDQKVAVVTGGASGIGRAMATRFAAEGMRLALVDIEPGPLEATAKALRDTGAEVASFITDVSDRDAMEKLAKDVVKHFGAVHLVCNNAGVASDGVPVWEQTHADWEFTLGANLWGVIHGVRVFAPYLLEQNEGHFVNTASMAGLVSTAFMGPYNVTKQGVVALSETLFADLTNVKSKVGVSVLCPAFVQTQIWNSDRNRPAHLQDPVEDAPRNEALPRDLLKGIIEQSMPTEKVADRVLEAVLSNRLYILTHESSKPALERRVGHILNDENPTETVPQMDRFDR